MTLRLGSRLGLWSALVVTAAVTMVGVTTLALLYLEKVAAFDERLHDTAAHFAGQYRHHGRDPGWVKEHTVGEVFHLDGGPVRFVEIYDAAGRRLFASSGLRGGELPALGEGPARWQGRRVRIIRHESDGLVIWHGMDAVTVFRVVRHVGYAYLAALPVVVLVVIYGSRLVAHQALAPVVRLAQVAEQISTQDFGRRLPVPEADDEILRLTRVLNSMLDRLETGFRQATRFTADASHELKTPVTVLRAGIEDLLHHAPRPEELRSALVGLLEQTSKLTSVMECLLLLSRLDAGQYRLDLQDVALGPLVEDVLEDARIMAAPHDLAMEVEVGEAIQVQASPGRVTQILLNLLDNAIKYNVPGGRITVCLRREDATAVVTVGNTSAATLGEWPERVFERFYRPVHAEDKPGHGLGLSLSRELARAHGGDLTLVVSNGTWTEFRLTLPVVPTPPSASA